MTIKNIKLTKVDDKNNKQNLRNVQKKTEKKINFPRKKNCVQKN